MNVFVLMMSWTNDDRRQRQRQKNRQRQGQK